MFTLFYANVLLKGGFESDEAEKTQAETQDASLIGSAAEDRYFSVCVLSAVDLSWYLLFSSSHRHRKHPTANIVCVHRFQDIKDDISYRVFLCDCSSASHDAGDIDDIFWAIKQAIRSSRCAKELQTLLRLHSLNPCINASRATVQVARCAHSDQLLCRVLDERLPEMHRWGPQE